MTPRFTFGEILVWFWQFGGEKQLAQSTSSEARLSDVYGSNKSFYQVAQILWKLVWSLTASWCFSPCTRFIPALVLVWALKQYALLIDPHVNRATETLSTKSEEGRVWNGLITECPPVEGVKVAKLPVSMSFCRWFWELGRWMWYYEIIF